MVKKIIALAIVLILTLAAPVYDVVVSEVEAVAYGEGDGESLVIEEPDELVSILASIPDIEDYLNLSEESITDLYEDFQTFTMTEVGYTENKTGRPTWDDEGEPVYEKKVDTTDRILTICFSEEAVYYHTTGSFTTETVYLERDEDENYGNHEEVIEGDRMTRTFDIEIFYAEDLMLLRYNDFDIVTQKYKSGEYYERKFKDVDGEPIADGVDITTADIVDAVSKTFGQWLVIDDPEDLEDIMGDFEDFEDLDEDEQAELLTEMLVIEFASMFSEAWTTETVNANRVNTGYLKGLANYITTHLDTSYELKGNKYELTGPNENDYQDDDDENWWEDYEYAKRSFYSGYLSALGMGSLSMTSNIPDVDAYFTVESDKPVVYQSIHSFYGQDGVESEMTVKSHTTFSGIDNTITDGSDKDIMTVIEAYREPLSELFEEYVEEMMEDYENE